MSKNIKPETEIRNLKDEIKKLRLLCEAVGIPVLIVYMPYLFIKEHNPTPPSKAAIKWAKDKIKEYELKFPKI